MIAVGQKVLEIWERENVIAVKHVVNVLIHQYAILANGQTAYRYYSDNATRNTSGWTRWKKAATTPDQVRTKEGFAKAKHPLLTD